MTAGTGDLRIDLGRGLGYVNRSWEENGIDRGVNNLNPLFI